MGGILGPEKSSAPPTTRVPSAIGCEPLQTTPGGGRRERRELFFSLRTKKPAGWDQTCWLTPPSNSTHHVEVGGGGCSEGGGVQASF